jgi:hypothetical protein
MSGFPKTVRVERSCVSVYIDDVRFGYGDALVVGHRSQQYPEFVWCATEDGRAGWAPETFIEMTGRTSAVALRDYDAAHLTVSAGESLTALEEVGLWLRCRNARGLEGWVPVACVTEAPEE